MENRYNRLNPTVQWLQAMPRKISDPETGLIHSGEEWARNGTQPDARYLSDFHLTSTPPCFLPGKAQGSWHKLSRIVDKGGGKLL